MYFIAYLLAFGALYRRPHEYVEAGGWSSTSCRSSRAVCVVGEDFADAKARVLCEHGVRLLVVGERGETGPERPAPAAQPRCIVDADGGTEDLAGAGAKQVPRDAKVAGRIADAEPAPVDDPGEGAVPN